MAVPYHPAGAIASDADGIGADVLREGWGDLVPWTEYPQHDHHGFNSQGLYYSSIDDRDDGKCRPLYETETDLRRQRAQVRALDLLTSTPSTVLESLKRYTFGTGWTLAVQPRPQVTLDAALQQNLQAFCDDLIEAAGLTSGFDLELHDRWRSDGELLAAWSPPLRNDSLPVLTTYDADQLTEPRAAGDLWDYAGRVCGFNAAEFVPSFSFGVLSPRHRAEQHLGYFVAFDSGARDWEILPESRAVFARRNVVRKAKRGVSDFAYVMQDIAGEAKLSRSMTKGAELQAAIAWIEEFAAGTSAAHAAVSGQTDLTSQRRPPIVGGTQPGQPIRATRVDSGTILRVGAGKQYKPGPMGAERNAGFIEVQQAALRHIGIRWLMPEYMISGDASNANYSSSLVSESPFVKARESDQQQFGHVLKELIWKGVRVAWEAGRLPWLERSGLTYTELKRAVVLEIDWPSVATRNMTELTAKLQVAADRGWVSDETASAELGYDYQQEVAKGARKAAPAGFGAPLLGGLQPALESLTSPASARAILAQLWEAYP